MEIGVPCSNIQRVSTQDRRAFNPTQDPGAQDPERRPTGIPMTPTLPCVSIKNASQGFETNMRDFDGALERGAGYLLGG